MRTIQVEAYLHKNGGPIEVTHDIGGPYILGPAVSVITETLSQEFMEGWFNAGLIPVTLTLEVPDGE